MLTVNYHGLLLTALLLNMALHLEGTTIVDSSKSISERIVQCYSVEFPPLQDESRRCNKVYSSEPDPKFQFGPEPEMGGMLLEVNCNRLNCFRVALLFDRNKNHTDCKVSEDFENKGILIMTCNSSIRVGDLLAGNYCVQYTEYDFLLNSENTCYRETTSTITHELKPKGSPQVPVVVYKYASPLENYSFLFYVIPSVFVLLAVAVYLLYRLRKKKSDDVVLPSNPAIIPTSPLSAAIKSAPLLNIFLLYSRDCPHHKAVVENLANFFVANNCKVAFSDWDIEDIANNRVGWVSEKLNGNYKIILVASRKCFARQQAWLQNEKCLEPNDTYGESLFIQAIVTIMHRIDQAFDYNKIFVVRPSYVSSDCIPSNICPGRHYVIPDRVAELLCHLHNIDTKCVKLDQFQLEQWNHCMAPFIAVRDSIDEITSGNIKCESCSQPNYGYITV